MNRIHEVDALRGFALLGILLVNVFVFHAPLCYYGEFYGAFEGIQMLTVDLVVDFAAGKFLFLFAFLFGYGIVLQQRSRQDAFRTYFVKRMVVLLVFGILHILLFWMGDILASYALLGLLVLPLLNLSNRGIILLSALFILFRPLYYVGVVAFDWPMINLEKPAELEEFLAVFQEGTYSEIFTLRLREFWAFMPENLVWYIPKTFGLFLLGIYAARISLFTRIRKHRMAYLVSSLFLIAISIVWAAYKMDVFNQIDLAAQPLWRPALITINVVVETGLGIGYILLFGILFQHRNSITKALSQTGRLALTNYILQSLFCVLIFYGYGLGYYGKLRPSDLVWITLSIFLFNVTFSSVYLRFRTVGPLEYVWRKLIYHEKT